MASNQMYREVVGTGVLTNLFIAWHYTYQIQCCISFTLCNIHLLLLLICLIIWYSQDGKQNYQSMGSKFLTKIVGVNLIILSMNPRSYCCNGLWLSIVSIVQNVITYSNVPNIRIHFRLYLLESQSRKLTTQFVEEQLEWWYYLENSLDHMNQHVSFMIIE